MYASTWICTKETSIEADEVKKHLKRSSLGSLSLGEPAMK